MSASWVLVAIFVAAAAALGMSRVSRRPKPTTLRLDPQEERLARKLASLVRCTVPEALPAVRREIEIAPHQSEEVLLKRAAYHYRQELPEKACPVYRDRTPG